MRKFAVLSVLFWIWLGFSTIQAESFFPDPSLDAAVRKQVFAGDKMTEDDLKKLSTLKATGSGIRDLRGLEKCTNLAALELADNQITDLTPLKGLTNLQTLTLSANKIQDISPLSPLTNLQYLELSRNEVSEISSLSKLTQLSALYLSGNRISNINAIQSLHKLSSLYLDGNKVSDLKPLADIRNLSSLDLSGNQVSDLSPISNMKYLRYLNINNNRLSDLKPLVVMSKKDFEGEKSFAPYLFLAANGAIPSTLLPRHNWQNSKVTESDCNLWKRPSAPRKQRSGSCKKAYRSEENISEVSQGNKTHQRHIHFEELQAGAEGLVNQRSSSAIYKSIANNEAPKRSCL
jgi:Leucine-rich repeat (LRR) protein